MVSSVDGNTTALCLSKYDVVGSVSASASNCFYTAFLYSGVVLRSATPGHFFLVVFRQPRGGPVQAPRR